MAESELIAGLDLGTTKVCAIVAERTEDGLDIIGFGSVPSKGLKKGVVVNVATGEESGAGEEMINACVSVARGAVEMDL